MKDTRVQKFISDCGVMSRRAAEKEISSGNVTINDEECKLGDKVDTIKDIVKIKGIRVAKKRSEHYTYIMLNKPRGYVTTMSDDRGRKCVADLVKGAGVRVYPVGRLDMETEGLLILTNDGSLAERLTHPRHEIPKIYSVRLEGELTNAQVRALSEPMEIDGYKLAPVGVELIKREDEKTTVRMTLIEGRNRQIRKMCESAGLNVLSLKRVAIGNLLISGVKRGEWRYLCKEEVDYLYGKNDSLTEQ